MTFFHTIPYHISNYHLSPLYILWCAKVTTLIMQKELNFLSY